MNYVVIYNDNDNDNDSALQHNSKYNNNNDHNSEVNVYCIEQLHVTSQVRRSTKCVAKTCGVCTGKGAF